MSCVSQQFVMVVVRTVLSRLCRRYCCSSSVYTRG